jgi:hypothetical protein
MLAWSWRGAGDVPNETTVERRLAAILVADAVGYSRFLGEDEAGTLTGLREIRREIVNPLLANMVPYFQAGGRWHACRVRQRWKRS